VTRWPGGNGITSDKVPTEISYENSAPKTHAPSANGGSNTNELVDIKWGFQFRPEEPRLRCIKLFLDRNQKLPSFVSPVETATILRRHNRTVTQAVSDYLRKIYEHAMVTLQRRYGEVFLSTTKVSSGDIRGSFQEVSQ
jgi:hypothetical protein